jgi:hypothetical protein
VAAADGPGRWAGWLAGARFLWQPTLRSLTGALALFVFASYGLTDVLSYYLSHDLRQPDRVVGLVLAIAALGTVGDAIATAPLRRVLGFGRCWIGALGLCGLAVAALGATAAVPVITVLAAGYLGCVSVAGICSVSLRQEVTRDRLLGRVTAAFWTLHFAPGPPGAALLTWVAAHAGVAVACLGSGLTCLLLAAAALRSPIRRSA